MVALIDHAVRPEPGLGPGQREGAANRPGTDRTQQQPIKPRPARNLVARYQRQ